MFAMTVEQFGRSAGEVSLVPFVDFNGVRSYIEAGSLAYCARVDGLGTRIPGAAARFHIDAPRAADLIEQLLARSDVREAYRTKYTTEEHLMAQNAEPASPYIRSRSQYRKPIVHVANYDRVTREGRILASVGMCGATPSDAQGFDDVPDGFLVCQRCAEQVEREKAKESMIDAPSLDKLRERESMLLAGLV